MSQVIALCTFEQATRVVESVRTLLSEDENAPQECLSEALTFVRRALNVGPLRDLVFTEVDLQCVAVLYGRCLKKGPVAVEEAMFCSLQRLRRETGAVLLDGKVTGPSLGYGVRYFVALRALGLVALIWQVNRYGQDAILDQAKLLA